MLHMMDGGRASPLYRHPVRKAEEGYTVNRVPSTDIPQRVHGYRIPDLPYRAISGIPGISGIPYTATILTNVSLNMIHCGESFSYAFFDVISSGDRNV